MIDSGSRNSYKLVYKVIKFAAQHKTPIHLSAFTYCEDELPSRMDLGKEKYGGSFTTKQVEDVKAFLEILWVLISLGPMLTTDIAANDMLYRISEHFQTDQYSQHLSLDTNQFIFLVMNGFEVGGLTNFGSYSYSYLPLYPSTLYPSLRSWDAQTYGAGNDHPYIVPTECFPY